MPYEWLPTPEPDAARLRLWPHRSLPRSGFVVFISVTSGLLAIPLMTQLGTPALWALLPFLVAPVAAIWAALQHSYKTGSVTEDLILTRDLITLHRHNPGRAAQDWQANPHWVQANLHRTGGPVPEYLTLSGNQREVELGAFLTPEERQELYRALQGLLQSGRQAEP